ncbi:WD repeat-containing protein 18 [Taenia solium]|eukprot:TsM_000318400 transcript=TsM_000318400 gene=TsM_000318400
MSQAPLLLTSAVDCGKREAVLVWDPIAGNQVASFSGASVAPGTLTAVDDVVVSAVSRKPILQSWSFRSSSSSKRLTTKGVVNALAFSYDGFFMYLAIEKSIYVYQVRSGCLIAVLEASHMAPIGALVVSQRHSGLSLPLLLSADTSGLVACWPALVSTSDTTIGSRDSTTTTNGSESDAKHKPLWYVVQASQGLPAFSFTVDGQMIACAGTDGVKATKCFDCRLPSTEKTICYVCASPVDSSLPLLAVSTPAGLVEILRQDACLVRLQRFSVILSPPGNSGSPRITGFLMVARPAWLLESQAAVGASTRSNSNDPLEILRPMKRHLGWQVEDLVYLQLPNLKRDRISNDYLEGIYQDEFFKTAGRHTFALPIDAVKACTASTSNDSAEMSALRREKEALEKRNGELMRILVASCLHY